MELMNLLNVIACGTIGINATLFYIFVFGRENRRIKHLNFIELLFLRIGLIIIAIGGIYECLIVDYPPNYQIIFNIGLAFVFMWAAIFHYKTFIKSNYQMTRE